MVPAKQRPTAGAVCLRGWLARSVTVSEITTMSRDESGEMEYVQGDLPGQHILPARVTVSSSSKLCMYSVHASEAHLQSPVRKRFSVS